MNCQDFENNVHDLAREQIMDAGVRAHAMAHRDNCEACGRRLEDERALNFKLRALAADGDSAEMPPLGDKLLTAFRNQQLARRQSAAAYRTYQSAHWAAAAVAAIVLAVIAISVFRFAAPVPPEPAGSANAAGVQSTPSPKSSIAKGPESVVGSIATGSQRRNATPRGRSTTGRNVRKSSPAVVAPAAAPILANRPSAPEIATDFIPVGYASATNLQDGGQIVRVELPRSALLAFGLPMNVNRYHEKVKADVFFGADGTARAIRFVQ